jgi:hypothetical protein
MPIQGCLARHDLDYILSRFQHVPYVSGIPLLRGIYALQVFKYGPEQYGFRNTAGVTPSTDRLPKSSDNSRSISTRSKRLAFAFFSTSTNTSKSLSELKSSRVAKPNTDKSGCRADGQVGYAFARHMKSNVNQGATVT